MTQAKSLPPKALSATLQFLASPMRVQQPASADIVLVPMVFWVVDGSNDIESFVEEAPSLLPLLGTRPHVMVLSHPFEAVHMYHPQGESMCMI